MTMFGIKEAVVAPLIRAVADEELSPPEIAERFARATWTGIAEPGDRLAGLLVQTLGPAPALAAVFERWPIPRLLTAITDAGGVIPTEQELTDALKRWLPRIGTPSPAVALQQAA